MNELDLFAAVIALVGPSERAALLDRECAGRPELRLRLDQLLEAHSRPEPLLDRPGFDRTQVHPATEVGDTPRVDEPVADATLDQSVLDQPRDHAAPEIVARDEQANAVIAGKYTLVEVVGEGGMGSVWRARQTAPVKRFVAVKLIKAGMDSRQVLARFDAERQALALMDHPNIAKVLDGGLHAGRPYFVMELVKGVPITEYCDARKLTPKERLELFVPVCQAVQHAHQKGIIHRDIKPSNVLIALYDDKPVVKVIDFGVAKATGGTLTEHTIDTGFAGVVGTPQYMSPEQATFNNLDVDTRSDVYALGVLLYELLTGSPPFSQKDLEQRGLLEMLRVVREEEPPRPSTKLSTADALPSLSANRGIEPSKLTGLLRNELDWVVMKALEKDRARRYETANGFAADVQRYLSGDAVRAHPPSASYRLRKFVRRNRGQVIAAGLVLAALVAGVVGTSVGLVRANHAARAERVARNDAVKQQRLAETAAEQERRAKDREAERAEGERRAKLDAVAKRQEAERNLAFAKKGNEILGSVFAGLDPKANYATVAELRNALKDNLARAVKELEGAAIGDPLEVAAMQDRLGLSLMGLGEANLAIDVFVKALATRKELLGADHPHTLTSMNNLAQGYAAVGKMDRALPLLEETFKLTTAKLGADHPGTLTSMNNLARGYQAVGQMDRALPLLEETFKLRTAKLGADHPDTLRSMNNLARGYEAVGQMDRALPLLEETFKLRTAKLGADHPDTLRSMNNLAVGYEAVGQTDRALPLLEEALKLQTAKQGADHPDTLTSMGNLALGYEAVGQMDRALPLYEETLKLMTAKLGADHPDTLTSMNNLAMGYQAVGKMDRALPLMEETLKLQTAKLGADHPGTLTSMNNLATGYYAVGQKDRALPLLEETLKLQTAKLGADHPGTLTSMNNLAMGYKAVGQMDRALPLLEETLKLQTAKLGADHPDTLMSMNNLAQGYRAVGKMDRALPLYEEALKLRTAKLGADHPTTLASMNNLAMGYQDVGKMDRALPLLEETLRLETAKQGADHPDTLMSMNNLAGGYQAVGQMDRALPLFERAACGIEKLGFQHQHAKPIVPNTIAAYEADRQFDKAEAWRRKWLAVVKARAGAASPAYAGELASLGLLLLKQRKGAEAEPILRESLALREKTQPDAWSTFNAQSMLGGALLDQKKYADAEPLLLKGYEGMKAREKAIPPPARIRIPEALDRLIELYTATDRPDEVKKWQAERAKYPIPREGDPKPKIVK